MPFSLKSKVEAELSKLVKIGILNEINHSMGKSHRGSTKEKFK